MAYLSLCTSLVISGTLEVLLTHPIDQQLSRSDAVQRFLVPFRMYATGWVLIVFCVLIGARLDGWELGMPMGALLVASLLLHELGHMAAAAALGVPVREFGLRLGGAFNRRAYATSRKDEILISAAGPLMNLCLVFPLLLLPRVGVQLALGNLALCVVNLLPLPSSDGLRIVRMMWGSDEVVAPVQ